MDDYSRHEALDRTNLMCDMILNNLLDHPYMLENKDLRGMVMRAIVLLETVYQQIGEEHLSDSK